MKYLLIFLVVLLFPDIVLGTDYRAGICWYATPFPVSRKYYEIKDTLYLNPDESYKAEFYLYLPNVVSGKRSITIDYAPDYLNNHMAFNTGSNGFRLDWYSGFYSDAKVRTTVSDSSYNSSWEYQNSDYEFWLGDFSFTNQLKPGDSLVYTVYVNALRTNGANHHFYHTRKIVCKSAVTTETVNHLARDFTLSVFPNPCQDLLTIKSWDYSVVKFIDISGRVLQEFELNPGENRVDVSSFKSGIYFLNFDGKTVKIIKQ